MLRDNRDKLLKIAVQGEIVAPSSSTYRAQWDGQPKLSIGMGGIKYNVKIGDSCFGWANGDHVEPGVTIRGKDKPVASDCEGKEAKGVFTGRHAGSDDMVWFNEKDIEKLAIGDKVQIKSYGAGLKLLDYPGIRVNKCSLKLLDSLGIQEKDGKLVVPVVNAVPSFLMGSGVGWSTVTEPGDYDIQTNDPKAIEKYNLESLRLGDIVALKDQLCINGRGYYKGSMTIGVIIHGASDFSGHGPGVNPILSSKDGQLVPKIVEKANIADYFGLD